MLPVIAKAFTNKKSLKTIGTVAGVAVVGYAGYRLYRNWKENKEKREFKSQLNQMKIDRNRLNFDETSYNLMLQDLIAAMDGTGTRESTVVSIFTHPNMGRDDILHLIHKFGIRDYGNTGKPGWWSRNVFGKSPLNLIGWMKEEMTEKELRKIKLVFKKNNIPF